MYGMIRLMFCSVIFGTYILFMIKKKKLTKIKLIFITIIVILLCTISGLFPVENYFYTFSTPEKAYNYINFETVALVVDGKESSLVIGEKDKLDYTYLILPKCLNGWKLGTGLDVKLKQQSINDDVVVSLYRYKQSSDYYIIVSSIDATNIKISDSCDSLFIKLDQEDKDKKIVSFYANVLQYDRNYWINVNGHKFTFLE